jgi:hypothetical protein
MTNDLKIPAQHHPFISLFKHYPSVVGFDKTPHHRYSLTLHGPGEQVKHIEQFQPDFKGMQASAQEWADLLGWPIHYFEEVRTYTSEVKEFHV